MPRVTCTVNGRRTVLEGHPMARLLDAIRQSGLTGTKEGCGEGDAAPACCSTACSSTAAHAAHAEGAAITTIEGVAGDGALHAIQASFLECGGAQCGICTPGMVLAAYELLAESESDRRGCARRASRNLCLVHRLICASSCRCCTPAARPGGWDDSAALRSIPARDAAVAGRGARRSRAASLRPSVRGGGTDLMVVLESGHLPPGRYVSLQQCRELTGIVESRLVSRRLRRPRPWRRRPRTP